MTAEKQGSVLILGSASSVARHIAIEFGRNGWNLLLADIDREENERIARDIRVRCGAECRVLDFDAAAPETHEAFVAQCREAYGADPSGIVLCFGYMPDQQEAQADFRLAERAITINYTGALSVLERFARIFEDRGSGFIAGISSAAGDRGRKANYIYGSAKAALTAYLSGLRNRLHNAGVSVTTVKPGFMDTRMTWAMDLPAPLTASPEAAARAIYRAIGKKRSVVYVVSVWRYIMLIIRHIPEWQFKRMDI
jgi:decaprenylphospho-beta-D-erythro-pentofuranosid-2-ulose 2-reductase